MRALYLFYFSQHATWIIAYSSGDRSIEKEMEAPPLQGQTEKAGAVQNMAKRRLCGNSMGTLQYLKGPIQKLERDSLSGTVDGEKSNGHKLEEGKLRLDYLL